jgi:hypothetical protein
VEGQAVTEDTHDVVTIGPDTKSDTGTTEAAISLLAREKTTSKSMG